MSSTVKFNMLCFYKIIFGLCHIYGKDPRFKASLTLASLILASSTARWCEAWRRHMLPPVCDSRPANDADDDTVSTGMMSPRGMTRRIGISPPIDGWR